MMQRGKFEKQCHAKLRHKSRAKAAKVAKRMGNTLVGRLNVYKCMWCGYYHVGRVKNMNGVKGE
jgi:rubrerythrin